MMNLKTILCLCLGLALVAPALSQNAGPRGGGQGGGMGRMGGMMRIENNVMPKLNLNASQKTRVAALQKKRNDDTRALMEQLRASMGTQGNRPGGAQGGRPGGSAQGGRPGGNAQGGRRMDPAMRERLMKIQTTYRDGLKKILTPAQFSQYEKLMQAEMQKMRQQWQQGGNRPGGNRAGGGAGRPGGGV